VIVDSSALVAILRVEPQAERFAGSPASAAELEAGLEVALRGCFCEEPASSPLSGSRA
jgi:hypothetical protein